DVEAVVSQRGERLGTGARGVEAGAGLARRRSDDADVGDGRSGSGDRLGYPADGVRGDRVAVDVARCRAGALHRGSHLPGDLCRSGRHEHAHDDVGLLDEVVEAGDIFEAGLAGQLAGAFAAAVETGDDAQAAV